MLEEIDESNVCQQHLPQACRPPIDAPTARQEVVGGLSQVVGEVDDKTHKAAAGSAGLESVPWARRPPPASSAGYARADRWR